MASKKWQGSDKKNDEDIQNLYIFGYQCKVFRDNEKAMFIDQGKHLIPWMGDQSLMIDRYDGRGHIYDLQPYDADFVDTTHYDLSEKEKAVEKACDEERYLELHTDIVQQEVYEEEEMKRMYEAMGEGYAAVGFNYNQPQPVPQQIQPQEQEPEEDEDEPYETIPDLQVPKGVNLPTSMKIHAIIEKTAAFVAKQGPQMEIVVATKQSNNPQFKFLNYNNELNVYYKHVVKMVKNGKYTPKPQEEYAKKKRRSSEGPEGGHGYLHPSLGGVTEAEPLPQQTSENFLKSVTAKLPTGQIANTAYAKLLNNLKKHRPDSPGPSTVSVHNRMSEGEVAKKTKQSKVSPASVSSAALIASEVESKSVHIDNRQPPVPGMDPVTLPGPNQPPPPGTVPPEPPISQHHQSASHDLHYPPQDAAYQSPYDQASFAADGYYAGYNAPPLSQGYTYTNGQPPMYHGPKGPPDGVYGPAGPPQGYGPMQQEAVFGPQGSPGSIHGPHNAAGSEESGAIRDGADVLEPIAELRPIIDKMAQYVVRNGPEFEMMMRNKKDERFSFLESWHEYHPYYEMQLAKARQNNAEEEENDVTEESESAGDMHGSQKGVSFSIKTKDGEAAQVAPKRRAILGGDSDDDNSNSSSQDSEPTDDSSRKSGGSSVSAAAATYQGPEGFASTSVTSASVPGSDAEKKQAEENLKNKLALAARGKLVQAKEDEKVKAERKKKAAMFAAFLKTSNTSTGSSGDSNAAIHTIHSAPNLSHLCESSAANSREVSPLPMGIASHGNSLACSPHRSHSRSRTRSPSTVKSSKSRSKPSRSRSRTPVKKSSFKRSRSRSKSKSKKLYKYRLSRSSSRSSREDSPPGLPSAYSMIRRSSPKSSKRRKSRSRSPSRRKHSRRSRSKSPRRSRSHRSRSRSRSRKHKRSRSRESKHKSKSKSKKRSRSRDRKRSKKSPKKSKPKMIPIPELTPPRKVISSDSDLEKETITIHSNTPSPTMVVYDELSRDDTTSNKASDVDLKGNDVKPSENLLSKVRAMLRAQREEIMKEEGMLSD